MVFRGLNNQSVEFKIKDYQFPDNAVFEEDANWLMVNLKVSSDFGTWEVTDPCLDTTELLSLSKWFYDLAKTPNTSNSIDFTEPCLTFKAIDYNFYNPIKLIRIIFEYEGKPTNADDSKEYFVNCEFSESDLLKISDDLDKELEKFPFRERNH